MDSVLGLEQLLDASPAQMRAALVVPAKAAPFPPIPIIVPRSPLSADVREDDELVLVLYEASIPVSTLRIPRQARSFLRVRTLVLCTAVEGQQEASSSTPLSIRYEKIFLASAAGAPMSRTPISMFP